MLRLDAKAHPNTGEEKAVPFTGRELRSEIGNDGTLTLSLEEVVIPDPADDEIVVRVEAAPINPSDLGVLLGPADLSTISEKTIDGRNALVATVPARRLNAVKGRVGHSLPVGNEGAGLVVAAGCNAQAFLGMRVGMFGGAMYADYRRIARHDVLPISDTATAADGAAMFVNPLTALGFVETARREGHKAIVHTAAASSLGQMLQRLCLADGVPLVNIVRSQEQVDILTAMGAEWVLSSQAEDFKARLTDAVAATGATIAFDAIGGGSLGGDIIQAMERAATGKASGFDRYGSETFKQLYIYGALDLSLTTLNRLAFGFHFSVSGWLLLPFLRKIGAERAGELRQRVVDELTTTFKSHFTQVIGLAEALGPDVLRRYERKATGEKYLIDPTLG